MLTYVLDFLDGGLKPPSPPLNPPLNYNEENIFLATSRLDQSRSRVDRNFCLISHVCICSLFHVLFSLFGRLFYFFSMLLLHMDYSLFCFLYLDVYFNFSILLLHTEFLYLDVYFYFFLFYCCTRSRPCASVKSEKIK